MEPPHMSDGTPRDHDGIPYKNGNCVVPFGVGCLSSALKYRQPENLLSILPPPKIRSSSQLI